jgi:hypothetical protein
MMTEPIFSTEQIAVLDESIKRPREEDEPESMSKTHDNDTGEEVPTRIEKKRRTSDEPSTKTGLDDADIVNKRVEIKESLINTIKKAVHSRTRKTKSKVTVPIPNMKAGLQIIGNHGTTSATSRIMETRNLTNDDMGKWLDINEEDLIIKDCKSNIVSSSDKGGKQVEEAVIQPAEILKATLKIKNTEMILDIQSQIHTEVKA